MVMCPLKSANFCLIPFLAPIPVDSVIKATIIPIATAIWPILIIVPERLFLLLLPIAIFFANHQVKFKMQKLKIIFQKLFPYTLIGLFLLSFNTSYAQNDDYERIYMGAENPELYLSLMLNKRVGVVTNQTGVLFKGTPLFSTSTLKLEKDIHLVDFLVEKKVDVKKIFSPEHGFRGDADAGETVKSGKDVKTGIPIVSLYGDNKKPTKGQLADLDVILFDIQDVGARFYTYISTLHYVMEAAAENGKKVILLDRPNPNGHYV